MSGASQSAGEWLDLLSRCADGVCEALDGFTDWSLPGDRPDQYKLDLVADGAALAVLGGAGVRVLSEESGFGGGGGSSGSDAGPGELVLSGDQAVVIVDPVDGSTNASRRIPYYCCSVAVLDAAGFAVGLVLNLVDGTRYTAVRGEGARRNGQPLVTAAVLPPAPDDLGGALIASNGALPKSIPRAQSRTTGSAALDLCGVAEARFDAFADTLRSLRVWDYAAGVLICTEAGAAVGELGGQPLAHASTSRRLGPAAARTAALLAAVTEGARAPG